MDYRPYFLSENPFPETAIVKIDAEDIRINGSIFFEEIFQNEIKLLRQKIATRTNLIYVSGMQFEKGVGKSALIVHEWRQLKYSPKTASVYIRCTETAPNNKPSGICSSIIAELHNNGYLWEAFRQHLLTYAEERGGLRITRPSVETMFNVLKKPPETVPLTLYTHVREPDALARGFAIWLSEKVRVEGSVPELFATTYLTHPDLFSEKFAGSREDKIKMYEGVLKITSSAGFTHHYFFLDQIEDAIMVTPTSKMGEFSLGMRRILEANINKATLIVTLHPDSEQKLNTKAAEHLRGLAPLDEKHMVDMITLEKRSEKVVPLATEYLKHFRLGEPPSKTYPFTTDVIHYICFLKDGNIRFVLQQLHECLKHGAMNDNPLLDMDYVLAHHGSTMGTELNREKYNIFKEGV